MRTKQDGVSLIEVIVGISIISIILVVVGYSVTAYVAARAALVDNTKALYLAEEGYEMLRVLRDEDWNTIDALTIGDTYFFDVATTTIAVGGSQEVIDGEFYRSFVLEDVYRDSDDDIASSTAPGATLDNDSVQVIMSVAGPTGTTSLTAIITNLFAI